MMQAPKHPPRFLPTLTEVVRQPQPAELPADIAISQPTLTPTSETWHASPEPEPAAMSDAELVGRVMQMLSPALEQIVQEALQQSLQARLQVLLPGVLQDVECTVARAVAEALANSRPGS
ncbi:hypothetical protein [Rhodoferax sp.]|uniref:hypothetical protein n=1 Tax=Rhodoferax sp. TaxID=50421 RepID=UPI0025FB46DD|nr:hypothetical protein [Rhodoferax sp.]